MNFVCSIRLNCSLWIDNCDSASRHHLSSAWITEDISVMISASLVLEINPFIIPIPFDNKRWHLLSSCGHIVFVFSISIIISAEVTFYPF